MEFYCPNGKRPVRLSEATRLFAYESLNAKYGRDAEKTMTVEADSVEGELSPQKIYDLGITAIAKKAPIRICEGELVSGAATLGEAILHKVPARYKGELVAYRSTSHLTIDFESVLKYGVNDIEKRAREALEKYRGTDKQEFAESCVACLDAFRIYHERYLDALSGMPEYNKNYENLKRVPYDTPRSFHEAVQSIWFVFSFVRLCGDWPGIGRIDQMLGPYLKADLEKGVLTLDEAREILAHFFIKGCEWIRGKQTVDGDAQHYQNLVLSGIDEDGNDVTNEVTYLVLDIIEETGISDFPTSVRLNRNTDEKLYNRVCEVIRLGGGVVAAYNEEVVIKALSDNGYSLPEARRFANDGCWEVQVPGKTHFDYLAIDGLAILQNDTLASYGEDVEFTDFDSLLKRYLSDMEKETLRVLDVRVEWFNDKSEVRDHWYCPTRPCTVVSLFEQGCIENGLSYENGGPIYNIASPHLGGMADTVNSLYAIKKAVFDDRIVSFKEMMSALRADWEGYGELKNTVARYSYYGTDNDDADAIFRAVADRFGEVGLNFKDEDMPYVFHCGISTFGRQVRWAQTRLATPFGRKAGEVLANNASPTPGTDLEGATAIIASYCKADHTKIVNGSALDLKLSVSVSKGESQTTELKGLLKSFVALGGFFMQPDVVDREVLKKAQADPELYRSLSVRVAGWNARFVTLSKEWQNMIIAMSEK